MTRTGDAERGTDTVQTRFSETEMGRRRAALGAEMERHGVSHALVYGANRSGSAVSWLTGWPVTREALLVLGADEADDLLLVGFYNHLPQARRLSRAPAAWVGPKAVATALDHIRARSGTPGRVGVIGQLPFDQHRILTDAAGEVVDLRAAYTALRLVKSGEEVAALRRAAALTDQAVAALGEHLTPGADDHHLVAAIQQSYVGRGGKHGIHYLGVTSMDDPEVAVPEQWPTGRRVRAGDVVTCEVSVAVAPEYAGQLLRTFTVAAEPTPRYRELHQVAQAAFDAVAARLRPGTHARELVEAAATIEERGYTVVDDVVHGYGGGYLPPVLRTPAQQHTPVPDLELATGMTLVVQPNVTTTDGRAGVQTGELLLVTDSGPERLHTFPAGMVTPDGRR